MADRNVCPTSLRGAAERNSIDGFAAVHQLANRIVLPPLAAIVDAGGYLAQQAEAEKLNAGNCAEDGEQHERIARHVGAVSGLHLYRRQASRHRDGKASEPKPAEKLD